MEKVVKEFDFKFDSSPTDSFIVADNIKYDSIRIHEYKMLENNKINGFLPISMKKTDDSFALYYNITSKQTLTDLLKRRKVNKNEFLELLKGIISTIIFSEGFLLSGNGFVLDETKIYVDPANLKTYLLYIPTYINNELGTNVKDLIIRLIVYHANIQNKEMDDFLQKILEFIRKDVYSLRELLALLEELGCAKNNDVILKKEVNENLSNLQQNNDKQIVKNKAIEKPKEKLPILLVGVLQIGIIIGILIAANYLKSYTEDTVTAYLGTAGIFFCLDFLALRKLFEKKTDTIKNDNAKENSKPNISATSLKSNNNNEKSKKENSELKNKKSDKKLKKIDIKVPEEIDINKACLDETCILSSKNSNYPILSSNSSFEAPRVEINKNSFIIGRMEGQVDYLSQNKAVGKLHAEIIKKQDKYFIKDLNSRNGTFLNNVKINSNIEIEIKDKDNIQMANSEFIFNLQ